MKISSHINRTPFTPISFPNTPVRMNGDFSGNVLESFGYFDPLLHQQVLEGHSPIYIARNVIKKEEAESIALQYSESPHKSTYSVRPVIERVGEPLYLGGDSEYFNTVGASMKNVAQVYKGADTENYVESLIIGIEDHFAKGQVEVRPFRHNGEDSFRGILRAWGTEGGNARGQSTEVHEDRIQQRNYFGYELYGAVNSALVSTCLYFTNGTGGGELTLYDLRPSLRYADIERTNSASGYGFHESVIKNSKRITIRPNEGDVISFNSSMLHEVGNSTNRNKESDIFAKSRITATFYSSVIYEDGKPVVLVWS